MAWAVCTPAHSAVPCVLLSEVCVPLEPASAWTLIAACPAVELTSQGMGLTVMELGMLVFSTRSLLDVLTE